MEKTIKKQTYPLTERNYKIRDAFDSMYEKTQSYNVLQHLFKRFSGDVDIYLLSELTKTDIKILSIFCLNQFINEEDIQKCTYSEYERLASQNPFDDDEKIYCRSMFQTSMRKLEKLGFIIRGRKRSLMIIDKSIYDLFTVNLKLDEERNGEI